MEQQPEQPSAGAETESADQVVPYEFPSHAESADVRADCGRRDRGPAGAGQGEYQREQTPGATRTAGSCLLAVRYFLQAAL